MNRRPTTKRVLTTFPSLTRSGRCGCSLRRLTRCYPFVANRKLMWSAWQDLKTYHRRPSLDLELDDALIAWCLDKTVTWFGVTVENALLERVEVGSGKDKRSEAKYSL